MNRKTLTLAIAMVAVPGVCHAQQSSATRIRARVDSLLSRMTLDEKIGQMTQLTIETVAATPTGEKNGFLALDSAKLDHAIVDRHIGSLINVTDGALSVEGWHRLITQIQDVATKETRLHIPLLYGIDFVHGANYIQTGTIFPENVAMGATFDTALARREGEITGREAYAAGLRWNFAPVLDVGRQPLFPRFYETFGEDPFVAATLGAAEIRGMQSSGRVAATLKHYFGYSGPRSGRDRTPADISEREAREHFLPSFRAGVRAGARSVMVNSGELDGVPLHASHYWLTDVLRNELGFEGVTVTDWQDIEFLHTRHHVAPTMRDAVRMAIDAGIDMSMTPYTFDFEDTLKALVNDRVISVRRIDESVRRILGMKMALGLFESPYPDAAAEREVGSSESRAVALGAAREAITLLKNDGGALPLRTSARVFVTGPAANSRTALNGGWSYTWQGADASKAPTNEPTMVDEIRQRAPNTTYLPGATFTSASDSGIAAAVAAAKGADVAIVAIGEDAYAEWIGDISDLTLPEPQMRLAQAIEATGTPTVLVLLEGRPRVIDPIVGSARGIVMAYWLGPQGAAAISDVLFGVVNPSGRLPFTYPRAVNELIPYDHRLSEDLNQGYDRHGGGFNPQFQFGDGLSYTTFKYDALRVDESVLSPGQSLHVSVTVTNTGARAGVTPVLLFTRQRYASITPAVRRLRAFQRVALEPGESKTLRFTLSRDDLTFVGQDGKPKLEPGMFDAMVGSLSTSFDVRTAPARASNQPSRRDGRGIP